MIVVERTHTYVVYELYGQLGLLENCILIIHVQLLKAQCCRILI